MYLKLGFLSFLFISNTTASATTQTSTTFVLERHRSKVTPLFRTCVGAYVCHHPIFARPIAVPDSRSTLDLKKQPLPVAKTQFTHRLRSLWDMKSTAWLSLLALAWSVEANPILGLLNPDCKVVHGECPHENITFWLYTNSTRDNPVLLNPLDLNPWDFQPARPVKILIHGYTGHRDFAPNSYIRPVLLDNEDVYVISIDYKPLVPDPCYFSAVQNLPLVSQCLAQLINNLVDRNIVPNENIHVIGFSLGGQVAGQTANYLKRKLKRITGLDPAKPMFVLAGNTSRLDPGDAEFVDVIHTNVFGRGILSPMGHVDFYPNVGSILQPGCREESPDSPGSCSHDRAPQFYAESINSTTGFWGRQCTSWLAYIVNLCPTTGKQELMGYHVSLETKGSYFLETGKSAPFALGKQEDVDNSQTLAQFKLNPELNEIPPDYEPQLLEAFLELDALKAVLNTDGSDLDKQLNWIGREEDEPLARAKL